MRSALIGPALMLGVLTSGCSTTSFAPPVVDLSHQTRVVSERNRPCAAQIVTGPDIMPDADGARALIENFIYVYRCRAHDAANGRQAFELPQLLVAAGGAIAAAYGAGADAAIGTGGAAALLGAAKGYYNPQQKAAIYDHALDALLCIKTESVGVAAFNVPVGITEGPPSSITVSAERRYYDMVTAALFSVERILSQRLSTAGTFDPAGLISEIEAVGKKVDAAKAKKDAEAAAMLTPEGRRLAALRAGAGGKDYELDLEVIQPKLQQCVLRAKL